MRAPSPNYRLINALTVITHLLLQGEWSFLVDKVRVTPWSAIITTQLVAALGLLALLVRFDARLYDYIWVVALVAYEVLVIRALVRRENK
jgi:hypothetical protein